MIRPPRRGGRLWHAPWKCPTVGRLIAETALSAICYPPGTAGRPRPTRASRTQPPGARDASPTAARQEQARRDLFAAVEERDRFIAQLEADIDRALLAALELGLGAPDLQVILGVSHATFWRRATAAGWKQDQPRPKQTNDT